MPRAQATSGRSVASGPCPTCPTARRASALPRSRTRRDPSCRARGRSGGAGDRVVADDQAGVEGRRRTSSVGIAGATCAGGRVRRSSASPTPSRPCARSADRSPATGSCCGASPSAAGSMRAGPSHRDQPAPRRRVPRVHAALVPVPHERLRPQRPPRRHPARPAADRPARRRRSTSILTPHVLEHVPDTGQGARRAVPGDRARRAHVPAGPARLRAPPRRRPSPSSMPTTRRCSGNFGWDLTDQLRAAGFHDDGAGDRASTTDVLRGELIEPDPHGDGFHVDSLVEHARPDDLTVVADDGRVTPDGLRAVLPLRHLGVPAPLRSRAPMRSVRATDQPIGVRRHMRIISRPSRPPCA